MSVQLGVLKGDRHHPDIEVWAPDFNVDSMWFAPDAVDPYDGEIHINRDQLNELAKIIDRALS